MEDSSHSTLRKRLTSAKGDTDLAPKALRLSDLATLVYSSEDAEHPVDNLLDEASGPGSTRWCAASPDEAAEIIVELDEVASFSRLIYEVEEAELERTQEMTIELSDDGGYSYRQVLVQEFTFSPAGANLQEEDLQVGAKDVTHLRLLIVPNKLGSGTASLTSLRLFR